MSASSSKIENSTATSVSVALSGLPESERLELLIESLTEHAIYMLDTEGFITSWNFGVKNVTGYHPEAVVGQHFSRLFTDEDRSAGVPARILENAVSNGLWKGEGWRLRKDGSRFLASSVLHPVRDNSGSLIGFAEIMRDITERVAAREALLERERRFRLLVEAVSGYAITMLDPGGVITSWNAGAERMQGYTAEEIVGQHSSRFFTPEERRDGVPWRVLETAEREGQCEFEGWRIRKDGSRLWASVAVHPIRESDGGLIGYAEITRDISDKKAVQEALRESERQLRLMVEGITDYALYMLDPNGIVSSWNAGAERIKGYAAEEIVGQHFSRFYTDRDKAAGVPMRALQIAASEGRFEVEEWRVRKTGERFWASVIVDPIRDEAGALVGFAKITRDITDKRESQIALRKAQEQSDHAQRMQALGQLTGGVAHDINNMLMVIDGFSQTIKKLIGEDPKGGRALDAIKLAVTRGQSLTRQLLTFSRRQSLNPVVTAIGDRLDAVRNMTEGSLGLGIKLAVDIPPETWPVIADVNELDLALLNIILNARDALPEGGMVTITTENRQLKRDETQAQLEGDFVSVTVADSGTGIAEEILPKVFDPFFTTKGSAKGAGLGLSQVHGFAHQSGGTVTVDSTLGRGTRVTLFLPRQPETIERNADVPPDAVQGTGLALLVDDNLDVLEVSSLYLKELGYQVHALSNPRAALKAIEQASYSLVVTDIVMPGGMDGIDLAKAIRDRQPGMPIVLVTAYSEVAASLGEDYVLVRKPYQVGDLGRAISSAISNSAEGQPSNLVHLDGRRRANPD